MFFKKKNKTPFQEYMEKIEKVNKEFNKIDKITKMLMEAQKSINK